VILSTAGREKFQQKITKETKKENPVKNARLFWESNVTKKIMRLAHAANPA
jgi:hypothetical protein